MPRMRILTANEQELFDRPPLFNHCDRKRFFDLPKGLLDIADSLRTPSGQIDWFLFDVWLFQSHKAVLPATRFS